MILPSVNLIRCMVDSTACLAGLPVGHKGVETNNLFPISCGLAIVIGENEISSNWRETKSKVEMMSFAIGVILSPYTPAGNGCTS